MATARKRPRAKRKTPPGVKPAKRLVRKISPDELAYHRRLTERVQETDAAATQAQQEAAKALAAAEDWMVHLQAKYDLPDGTGIDSDGTINRP